MAGIQLSGLASGLDWQSLVTKLMDAERTPETQMRTEKGTNLQISSALDTIRTNLTALQTSLTALASDSADIFSARKAAIADSTSGWSASAAAGAEITTHEVTVTQLATKSQRLGTPQVGGGLSASSDVSGLTIATLPVATRIVAGDFTVNGAKVTVSAADSLQDVFNKISTATGGAVTASYDPATDRVQLQSGSEIVLGASNDTSNLLMALGLGNNATGTIISPKALGVVSLSSVIASANLARAVTGVDAAGNGSFSINGVAINYNVNSDSVGTVISRINSSTAGVTASYDRVNDRFLLTNKNTGDTGLSVSEGAGGLLGALGIDGSATLQRGKNAEFTIDGSDPLTSASNTLTTDAHGVAGLSLTVTSLGEQSVNVAGDSSGVRTKIEDFIKSYNAVQSYIESQTKTSTSSDGKVTSSTLSKDRDVADLAKAIRAKIFDAVPGLTGTIKRLEGLGIDFKAGTSELEVKNSDQLDDAINNRAGEVQTLFASKPDGLVARVNAYITKVTGSDGILTMQSTSLSKRNTAIDEQIATMERRLTQEQQLLESGFIQMEKTQSEIQSQLTALTNAFGGTSSSSSSSK